MSVLYGKENIRIRRIQRLQPNYTEDPRKTTKHKKVPWIPCAHRKCRRLHQTVDQCACVLAIARMIQYIINYSLLKNALPGRSRNVEKHIIFRT